MAKIIEQQWQSFQQTAIPVNAPLIQRREMKKAFYAGALAILGLAYDIGGDDDVSEEQGAAILEAMREECLGFIVNLGVNKGSNHEEP